MLELLSKYASVIGAVSALISALGIVGGWVFFLGRFKGDYDGFKHYVRGELVWIKAALVGRVTPVHIPPRASEKANSVRLVEGD